MMSVGRQTQSLGLLQLGSCSLGLLFHYQKDCSLLLQAVQLWQGILNRLEIPSKALKTAMMKYLGTPYAQGGGLLIE